MKKSATTTFITLIVISLLASESNGDARAEVIKLYCDDELEADQTIFVQNFIRLMEITGTQLQSSHNSTASVGVEPNRNNGIAQCYGDLSTQDCILCFAEIRTVFPNCFPRNGGRIYLDGCFMRSQNYSFYDEYAGPNDTTVCGNTTRKSTLFQESTRRAVANVVKGTLRNSDYFAREEMLVSGSNNSVYVLAQCWKTLSPSSCKACLENASVSVSKCLPWSEGRVLNTGCFMRFSDTNFLNPLPVSTRSRNKGRIIAIVFSVVSCAVVLTIALMITFYIKKRRYIRQKREGITIWIVLYV